MVGLVKTSRQSVMRRQLILFSLHYYLQRPTTRRLAQTIWLSHFFAAVYWRGRMWPGGTPRVGVNFQCGDRTGFILPRGVFTGSIAQGHEDCAVLTNAFGVVIVDDTYLVITALQSILFRTYVFLLV